MSPRMWKVVWLGAVVGIAVLWLQYGRSNSAVSATPVEPVPVVTTDGARSDNAGVSALVHVSGAVAAPGVVRLDLPAILADAVIAAGGVTPEADLGAVNLAMAVTDGQQIVVPARGSEVAAAPPLGAAGELIAINSATPEELQRIPGVGPVLAHRIVQYRDDRGPFSVVEDLLDVPGIGEGRLADLRNNVSVP